MTVNYFPFKNFKKEKRQEKREKSVRMGRNGEGSKKLQNSQRGCKVQHKEYSPNIVITIYGARWVLDSSRG